jgi:threonine synthase
VAVLSLYIDDHEISQAELKSLVQESYSTFRDPVVAPLKKLDDSRYVLELWHGPTWAFKDVALQLLGNFFEFFLKRRNANKKEGETREILTVVGATSGDTGRYVSDIAPSIELQLRYRTALLSTVSETRRISPSLSCTQKVASLRSKRPR